MAFDFDTSELTQASARKVTPHDNCVVLDLGTGTFPRDIEVRLPDDDGARQTALWDGGLDLAINDEVLCHEYAGLSAWRVVSMGGNESGAGQVRVNKVWAEDFTSESLVTDTSDNVTINTGTLTLPSDIIHLGDADTKISFDADDIEFTAGGLSMLKLTEAGQNLITLGPGSGDIDINFNGDAFLRGSDGFFGIGTASPAAELDVTGDILADKDENSSRTIKAVNNNDGTNTFSGLSVATHITTDNQGFNVQVFPDAFNQFTGIGGMALAGWARFRSDGNVRGFILNASNAAGQLIFGTANTERMRILSGGNVGIGATAPGSLTEWNFTTEDLEFVDAGSAAATEQDWIEVQVAGATGYIRVFASK